MPNPNEKLPEHTKSTLANLFNFERFSKLDKPKKIALGCWTLGCLIPLVIFIIVFVVAMLQPSTPESTEDSAKNMAAYMAQKYLKDNLNDPDSLKIVFENTARQTEPGKNGYVVYIKYRAKNAFGAYILSGEYFVTDEKGNVVQVMPDPTQ